MKLFLLLSVFWMFSLTGIEIPYPYSIVSEGGGYREQDFLVSYERSGNTWMRYCLEFLTKRPTIRLSDEELLEKYVEIKPQGHHLRLPIQNEIDLDVDYTNQAIIKVHDFVKRYPRAVPRRSLGTKFILLIRNPKECFYRHIGSEKGVIKAVKTPNFYFFTNLIRFDSWPNENRLLVYYEDFITNPRETLSKVLSFLGEEDTYMDDFFRDYEFHKKRCIDHYEYLQKQDHQYSHTKGESLIFHSSKMSKETLREVDHLIQLNYPDLWKKYLSRYEEK